MSSFLSAEQSRLIIRSQAVQYYLGKNADVYSSVDPFVKQVTLLTANNEQIAELIPGKGTNGKGATRNKKTLKLAIAKAAGSVCAFTYDYALDTEDNELQNAVNFSSSNIRYLHDAEMLGFVNAIVGVVRPLVSLMAAAGYPLTVAQLDGLSEDADTFNSNLGKAESIDRDSTIASDNINAVLKNIQLNINRLNRLVNYFEGDNPDFVAGYRKATVVDKSNIRHSGIEGIVINNNTEGPIAGVTITLAGKRKTKTTTTGSDGSYRISPFAGGKCKLTVTAPGYESRTMEVKIGRGKISTLDVSLLTQVVEFKTA